MWVYSFKSFPLINFRGTSLKCKIGKAKLMQAVAELEFKGVELLKDASSLNSRI